MINQSGSKDTSHVNITIGLSVKNSEKSIRKCLESIVNQDYPKELMEIIVVDGGRKDRTMEIVKDVISSAGLLSRFYFDSGKGLGFARRIALGNVNSEYVVWVNGAVIISKYFVKNQVAFMEEYPDLGVATGKSVFQTDAAHIAAASSCCWIEHS